MDRFAVVDSFPDDTTPACLLRERDAIYGDVFRQRMKDMQIEEVLTAPRSPCLSDSPVAPTRAPLMGEHTEAVLQSLAGLSADEVRALREKRVI